MGFWKALGQWVASDNVEEMTRRLYENDEKPEARPGHRVLMTSFGWEQYPLCEHGEAKIFCDVCGNRELSDDEIAVLDAEEEAERARAVEIARREATGQWPNRLDQASHADEQARRDRLSRLEKLAARPVGKSRRS